MKDTTAKGNLTEAVVLAALMKRGSVVLMPFGVQMDYDLVFESDGRFCRVQCKTGIVKNGSVSFGLCSTGRDGKKRAYGDSVEFYGVYVPELNKVYLVPSGDVGTKEARLRIEPARNGQERGIRWAEGYEIPI